MVLGVNNYLKKNKMKDKRILYFTFTVLGIFAYMSMSYAKSQKSILKYVQ